MSIHTDEHTGRLTGPAHRTQDPESSGLALILVLAALIVLAALLV